MIVTWILLLHLLEPLYVLLPPPSQVDCYIEAPVLEPLYGLLPHLARLFLREDGNRVQLHHGACSIHPRLLILQDKVPMGKHHAWQLTLSAIMFFNSIMDLVGTRNYYDVRKEREGGAFGDKVVKQAHGPKASLEMLMRSAQGKPKESMIFKAVMDLDGIIC